MAPKFNPDRIRVDQVKCYFDPKTSTKVTEKPCLVQYESQHFKCKALVELEESVADSHWTIGLIQACDRMYLENRYGKFGSSFWEFHPLKTRQHRMVNDSDGRQYPFYSLTSSKCEVTRGVVRDSVIKLQYADHFYPTVAWDLPYYNGVKLTDVIRRQSFWIWLVAIRRAAVHSDSDIFHLGTDEIHILSSMQWHYSLHMEFDPHERIGRRLKRMSDTQHELPDMQCADTPIPLSAVHPPHCNAAQSLIWYPKMATDRPDLLVPPKQTIVPWDHWVRDMMPGVPPGRVHKPKDLHLCPTWQTDSNVGLFAGPASSRWGIAGGAMERHRHHHQQHRKVPAGGGHAVARVGNSSSSKSGTQLDREERKLRRLWTNASGGGGGRSSRLDKQ